MSYELPIRIDKGNGTTTLVLLHGLGTNYKSWKYVLDNLDYDKYRVIVMDLLGFGDAPKPTDIAYSAKDHAEAVLHTLEKLKISKAIIAGHSMGCIVALELANIRPQIAQHLILLGAPLYKTIPEAKTWRRFLKIEGLYFSIFNQIKDNPNAVMYTTELADSLLPFLHGMEITEDTWPAFYKSLENTVMKTRGYEVAKNINTPTTLVYGILDIFVSKRNLMLVFNKNKNIKFKYSIGPHEITPLQGKYTTKLVDKISKKHKA